MTKMSLETQRRMKFLNLEPIETKDSTGIVVTDCNKGIIRPLSISELQHLNTLRGYEKFDVYHAISYRENGIDKCAFLVTSPFSSEWDLEFIKTPDSISCFAFVFRADAETPVKEMLTLEVTEQGLEVAKEQKELRTTIFM